jgi:Arc/MetJ-type ribon-helix-helix transcriptional regulator
MGRRSLRARAAALARQEPYRLGVSTQIVVRLPDETVAFLDWLVAEKKAASRAEIIARALERERRREMAARDAAILAESGEDPDLAGLVQDMAGHPVDPDR